MQTFKPGEHTQEQWAELVKMAGEIGTEHGKNAASWVDVPDEDTAERWVKGFEDGDPAVMDLLPNKPLSAEHDDYNMVQFYKDLGVTLLHDTDDLQLCNAYDEAYNSAVQSEVERRARAMLAP